MVLAQYATEKPSWAQLHRLGQLELELAHGMHNPHYTVRAEWIEPALETGRLRAAWQMVVTLHPILGSAFTLRPMAWRIPTGTPRCWFVECAPEQFQEAVVAPFDYETGPLARLVVAQGGGATLVGVAIEHLVSDGWSLAGVWAELISGYARAGEPLHGEPEWGFRDWVAAEHERLADPVVERRIRALQQNLGPVGGAIPALPFARCPGLGSVNSTAIGKEESRFSVPEETWIRICRVAAAMRLSGASVLLCALHVALHQLTGLPNVGTTLAMAGRSGPAQRRFVGWFADKLVVRSDMSQLNGDLHAYLRYWRRGFWAALDSIDIPWAYLVSRLNPSDFGRFSATPFITFNFQPVKMGAPSAPKWHEGQLVTAQDVATGHREAAMSTFWIERDDGVEVQWRRQSAAISSPVAEQLWLSLSGLLEDVARAR